VIPKLLPVKVLLVFEFGLPMTIGLVLLFEQHFLIIFEEVLHTLRLSRFLRLFFLDHLLLRLLVEPIFRHKLFSLLKYYLLHEHLFPVLPSNHVSPNTTSFS